MAATTMFAAQRAIIDRLRELVEVAGPESPLYQVVVWDAYPGPPDSETMIYGADFASFDRGDGEDNAYDGTREINRELVIIPLVLRAAIAPTPVDGVRATNRIVGELADYLDELIRVERDLAGTNTYAAVLGGRAANPSDESRAVSSLLVRVGVDSHVTGG